GLAGGTLVISTVGVRGNGPASVGHHDNLIRAVGEAAAQDGRQSAYIRGAEREITCVVHGAKQRGSAELAVWRQVDVVYPGPRSNTAADVLHFPGDGLGLARLA